MLKIQKVSSTSDELRMTIEGNVNDDIEELLDLVEDSHRLIIVDCEKVDVVTSLGIMTWMQVFDKLRAGGKTLKFNKCSPAVMRTNSMMRNGIIKNEELESFMLPFYCDLCEKLYLQQSSSEQLEQAGRTIEPPYCEVHPDHLLELDEVPEIFFS